MLKWGIVGASDIAATRMLPAIRSAGGSVQVVLSGSSARASRFASDCNIASHTDDLDWLLAQDIEAVYISSTNEKHFSQAMRALDSGKHVLCEKPMALSVDEAVAMVELAADKYLTLAVNHHIPSATLHRRVREMIDAGKIGTILAAQVSHAGLLPERLRGWRLTNPEAGSGVILDLTCHDASVLNPLLGTPVSVSALAVNHAEWNLGGSADTAMTVIEYVSPDGHAIVAQTFDSFAMEHGSTWMTVHGTKGLLHASDAMTQESGGTITVLSSTGTEVTVVDSEEDPYAVVVAAFQNAVVTGEEPAVSGWEGVQALKVALAAQQAAESGRTMYLDEFRSE
ncbi:1,5-anhydro-D-fructose reductase (plasmid) [Arthrobacter sp. StoSoilB3]|nr:1,5-anhydro-D-fructose reductase [Arthrobacter sp. StoSoilB3]